MATPPSQALLPGALWRSSFVFLDETGTLASPRDRFFGVGMLKCPEPSIIQRPIQALRQRNHFDAEFKWTEIRRNSVPVIKAALDCFFAASAARFACFIADKQTNDPIGSFGNQWNAYEKLACQLLVGNIAPTEQIVVLADEYSTPPHITFEASVRECVNRRLNQKHVIGVCRMRSTGVDLFQILDLILGAVAYEYKLKEGLVPGSPSKQLVLSYVKQKLGVATFVGGVKNGRVNVVQRH